MNSIFRLGYFIRSIYLTALLVCSLSHAEIHWQDVKGTYELLDPSYQYLSPVHGLALLATKTINNRRIYGNYGPKKVEFGCLELSKKMHEVLSSSNDCPQDYTSELVQRLFPYQDGVTISDNFIQKDPISRLKPVVIGKILGTISKISDEDLIDVQKEKMIIQDLKLILSETSVQPKVSQDDIELTKFDQIAHLLVSSLKESHFATHRYPSHFQEQVLTTYIWKKGDGKKDLLDFFLGLAETNPKTMKDPTFIGSQEKRAAFLNSRFPLEQHQSSEFDKEKISLLADGKKMKDYVNQLIQDPERLAFFAMTEKSKKMPPMLDYGITQHSGVRYPNCGDTALHNFLNIMIYDPITMKFNPSYLKDLESKDRSLKVHENLRLYYENNSDFAGANSQAKRDEWGKSVASHHAGVGYDNQDAMCGITLTGKAASPAGSLDNSLKVLHRLLYQNSDPITKVQTRSQKLDRLCEEFSRKDFKLGWKYKAGSESDKDSLNSINYILGDNHDIQLEFSINGIPSFQWRFTGPHMYIKSLVDEKINTFMSEVGIQSLKLFLKNEKLRSIEFLQWFGTYDDFGKYVDTEVPKRGPEFEMIRNHLPYSYDLSTLVGRDEVVLRLLGGAPSQGLKVFITKVLEQIPEDDFGKVRLKKLYKRSYLENVL